MRCTGYSGYGWPGGIFYYEKMPKVQSSSLLFKVSTFYFMFGLPRGGSLYFSAMGMCIPVESRVRFHYCGGTVAFRHGSSGVKLASFFAWRGGNISSRLLTQTTMISFLAFAPPYFLSSSALC